VARLIDPLANAEGPAERRPFLFGLPVFATLVVLTAVATMIGLGLWQIGRAEEKETALSRIAENVRQPRLVLSGNPDLRANLLRPVTIRCMSASPTRIAGAGKFGFRVIADCSAPALGKTLPLQLGTVRTPGPQAAWPGGEVQGYLAQAPDNRSLLRQLFDRSPAGMMVVAQPAVAGFAANPPPSLEDIPNNHRSYAVQWFAFAGIALIIFVLALRRRRS
jgi:surfeit locus 1 family protein